MSQLDMFDRDEGKRLGDEGMAKAARAARVQAWKVDASAWLANQHGREITADDLTRVVGVPDIGANRNNVIGAWFNAQARAGKIIFAQRMRKSDRITRHGNVQRVWIVL